MQKFIPQNVLLIASILGLVAIGWVVSLRPELLVGMLISIWVIMLYFLNQDAWRK
jgi:hypothetical protein